MIECVECGKEHSGIEGIGVECGETIRKRATLAENERIRKIFQGKIEARRKMFLKELHKDDIIKEMQFLHSLFQQIQPKAEGDENASRKG